MTTVIAESTNTLISHTRTKIFDIKATQDRLKTQQDLTFSLQETLSLLNDLTQFELGYFLLHNQGLNGYWTSYLIVHGPKKQNLHPLEAWMLKEAPVVRATQERFQIFQAALQRYVQPSHTLASIPCGVMDDLLSLDYSQMSQVSLEGVDLDETSLVLAQQNATNYKKAASFLNRNAWEMDIQEKYNIITSNGLNIYEPSDEKVTQLYRQFSNALKPKGILITSFLTPPPSISKESTWKNVNQDNLRKQKAIFADIIQAKWQVFRTETQTRSHLEAAGFQVLEVIYDSQGMFPTIIAQKP